MLFSFSKCFSMNIQGESPLLSLKRAGQTSDRKDLGRVHSVSEQAEGLDWTLQVYDSMATPQSLQNCMVCSQNHKSSLASLETQCWKAQFNFRFIAVIKTEQNQPKTEPPT